MRAGLMLFPTLAVTCAAAFAAPVHAQVQPALPVASTPVLVTLKAGAAKVDEGALRYYAQQGQKDRVEAEIHHLQSAHPGYVPPADLYKPQTGEGSPEDQPLWDLFGADKLDELKAGIAARMDEDPGWKAPADLVLKIRIKETRHKMLALSGDAQWKKLIRLAKEDPDAVDTGDVELMWALAESHGRAKQNNEALGIYLNLLRDNEKPEERLATLQKSMAVLRMADVEKLYELGRKNADAVNEFDVILTDLTRARISAFLHDERKDDLNQDHVKLFADYSRTVEDPNQPGLVAWYHYKRREFSEALDWFKYALEKGGDAKIAHGLAHSLRQLRKFREAEEVAFAWRDYDVANKLLYVDLLEMDLTKEVPPYIEDERLARYGKLAADDSSGEGAQALAWYAYNSCQYYTALEWFQRANAWFPKEATAYGLALTYRRLGDRKNFIETVNRYDGLFPKVVALVFPDDRYLPPTPCEETVLAPQAAAFQMPQPNQQVPGAGRPAIGAANAGIGLQQNAEMSLTGNGAEAVMPNPMTDPTMVYPVGTAPNYPGSIHDPLWRYSWGRVPSPTGQPYRALAPNYHGEPWQPAPFNPNEFPVMVDLQNPLRFAATGLPSATPAPAAALPPAAQLAQAPEPLLPPWPLLARKVPGVLPMPYETNGFTLQYVNIPDPRRKGAMMQLLRFVPPPGYRQGMATSWNQPVYGQPAALPALVPVLAQFGSVPLPPSPLPLQPRPPGGPQSRLQQLDLQTTGTLLQPQPAFAAPVSPAYVPPPASLLPPGYQPLVTPQMPQPVAAPVYAPQPAYPGAQTYAPAPVYAPQPAYAPQPLSYSAPQVPQEPVAAPRAPLRFRARAVSQRPAAPARHSIVAVRNYGGGCGAGGGGAQGALTQGWCLLNADRPREAALAFDQAIQGGLGKTREDAAYGKSLAELRANQTDSAVQAANSAQMSPERRNEIGIAVLAQRAQGFYNQGNYRQALAALDQRIAHTTETRDLSMMRGWSLFHLDRTEEAERLFQVLDRQTSTKESRQGLGAIDSRTLGRNR